MIAPRHPGLGVSPRPDWCTSVEDLSYLHLEWLDRLDVLRIALTSDGRDLRDQPWSRTRFDIVFAPQSSSAARAARMGHRSGASEASCTALEADYTGQLDTHLHYWRLQDRGPSQTRE